ncbi:hypothetical protein MTO96_023708 [Rhipicephalus appendiculatus]
MRVIHANEACRKAVLQLEGHKPIANDTKPELKPGKFAKVLTKCYHKKLTKNERHHVCESKRRVKKVLQCFKRALHTTTPKKSRKPLEENLQTVPEMLYGHVYAGSGQRRKRHHVSEGAHHK